MTLSAHGSRAFIECSRLKRDVIIEITEISGWRGLWGGLTLLLGFRRGPLPCRATVSASTEHLHPIHLDFSRVSILP